MRQAAKIPDKIVSVVNALLAREFEIEEARLRPAARLKDDLGLDSLDGIDMVILLEQEFDIAIDDDDLERSKSMKTLQDLYRFIADMVAKGSAGK
jgi:acyl carrier protein